MVESRREAALDVGLRRFDQNSPVLVMTIGVADERVENDVAGELPLGCRRRCFRPRGDFESMENVGERMSRLPEAFVAIVRHRGSEDFITVPKCAVIARKRLGNGTSNTADRRQLHYGVKDSEVTCDLGGDLLSPMLAGALLGIFEQPRGLAAGTPIPELVLATHRFMDEHTVRIDLLNGKERVFRHGGGYCARYPGPRRTRPGRASVGRPSAMTATPFTKTQSMPMG